tara:strand:+ start:14622 stop:14822 length:201 start_codon:yes stop_codon:yes gene_type:complete
MRTIKIRDDDDDSVIEEITVDEVEHLIYTILAKSGATWTSCECCSRYGEDTRIAVELAKEIVKEAV